MIRTDKGQQYDF